MERKIRIVKESFYGAIDSEKANIERMKKIQEIENSRSIEKYKLGEDWFNNGFSFEEAPLELQENISFKYGFERGKRLAYIQGLIENDSKTKKK